MDANPAPSLKLGLVLGVLCVLTAAVGMAWQAWDMFTPSRRPMLQGWDDSYYYFWLPSVVIDHDVDFTNQLRESDTLDAGVRDAALAGPRTRTGLIPNKYPPGWALGSLPFFLVAHVAAPASSTGFEPRYLVAVWLGQLAYAAAGLWCAIAIVARYVPRRIAVISVFGVWLASPLVYYQGARISMSHSQVFALAVLVFYLALELRDGKRGRWTWCALGFSAALLVVTRNLAIVYLIAPAYVMVRHLRNVRDAAALLAGAVVPAVVQIAAWRALYGEWIVYSYGGERFDFGHLHLAEVLFSPKHGWFYWHPALLVGIGAFIVWGGRRAEGACWIVSLGITVLLSAAWPMWWLGSSFGHRGFEVATFFAMIGFAVLLHAVAQRTTWRRVLWGLGAGAIAWNLALLALFLTQRIPREEPVRYREAAHALYGWISGAR